MIWTEGIVSMTEQETLKEGKAETLKVLDTTQDRDLVLPCAMGL